MPDADAISRMQMTTQIVSAYVGNNTLPAADIPKLIQDVYQTLAALGEARAPAAPETLRPAVAPKKSIFDDHIVCLEDGKKFKSLKRHLRSQYNLTPAQYREKWGLPADYPMVAPDYAKARSRLAKQAGLGQPRNGRD